MTAYKSDAETTRNARLQSAPQQPQARQGLAAAAYRSVLHLPPPPCLSTHKPGPNTLMGGLADLGAAAATEADAHAGGNL